LSILPRRAAFVSSIPCSLQPKDLAMAEKKASKKATKPAKKAADKKAPKQGKK
jgi:hypothetical protein